MASSRASQNDATLFSYRRASRAKDLGLSRSHQLRLGLLHLRRIGQERCQSFIGQRMVEHHVQHLPGKRAHMRAGKRSFYYVQRMPQRSRKNLRLESVIRIDGLDVADQLHAVLADVVEPADERAA